MRSLLTALIYVCLFTSACLLAPAALRAQSLPSLTVLLSVDGKNSDAALKELKAELQQIMKDSGRNLDVRLKSQADPAEVFEDVVLVKLNGNCRIEKLVGLMDERGPYAWTHSTDGVVLPFAEVSCDRIAASVAKALWGEERKQANQLLGRALGRVLAHELYHILGRTHTHNADGSLAKEAISAKRLISDKRIGFDSRDLHMMLP